MFLGMGGSNVSKHKTLQGYENSVIFNSFFLSKHIQFKFNCTRAHRIAAFVSIQQGNSLTNTGNRTPSNEYLLPSVIKSNSEAFNKCNFLIRTIVMLASSASIPLTTHRQWCNANNSWFYVTHHAASSYKGHALPRPTLPRPPPDKHKVGLDGTDLHNQQHLSNFRQLNSVIYHTGHAAWL